MSYAISHLRGATSSQQQHFNIIYVYPNYYLCMLSNVTHQDHVHSHPLLGLEKGNWHSLASPHQLLLSSPTTLASLPQCGP